MKRVMGYCDRWSAGPGETVRFKVSCIGTDQYDAQIVRLKQPDAGKQATRFEPEPIAADCNGPHPGRHQPIPIGGAAAVPAHPAIPSGGCFSLCAWVYPTTPDKGRQAVMGTWCEAAQTGFGIEILDGAFALRVGATVLSAKVKLLARRWYFVAATFEAATGTITLLQEPRTDHDFHPIDGTKVQGIAGAYARTPHGLTFAAWSAGKSAGPSSWNGLAFACHMNGRIDSPRLAATALDRAGIARLAADPLDVALVRDLVAAWDFAIGIPTETITDLGPHRLDGSTINLPTRAVRGWNWDATETNWTRAPQQYGAIHFHDTDLADAGWADDFAFTIPDGLRSGIYAAHLTTPEFDYWIPFFVVPPRGTARSKVAFLASTATYTVYLNNRGRYLSTTTERYHGRVTALDDIDALLIEFPEMGLSTYDRHSDGSGVSISSRHRPLQNFRPNGRHWNFNLDLFIIDWLEKLGGDYDVITEEDLHTHGYDLLRPYQVIITGSHPEYDSRDMLDAFETYLRRGGRMMYMGGNGFYWRIAHHPVRAGVIEVRRAEGGVRAWDTEPGEAFHAFTGEYGGLWRRNMRAPQRLVGVGFISQGFDQCSYYRRTEDAKNPRVGWMFDGVEGDLLGNFGILQGGAAGLEIDAADRGLGTPAHALVVGRSENHSNTYELVAEEVLIPHGATDAVINPDIHADLTFFETGQGGAVFSTGSIAYSGSLGWNSFDNNLFHLTTNVLNRFKDPTPFPEPGAG